MGIYDVPELARRELREYFSHNDMVVTPSYSLVAERAGRPATLSISLSDIEGKPGAAGYVFGWGAVPAKIENPGQKQFLHGLVRELADNGYIPAGTSLQVIDEVNLPKALSSRGQKKEIFAVVGSNGNVRLEIPTNLIPQQKISQDLAAAAANLDDSSAEHPPIEPVRRAPPNRVDEEASLAMTPREEFLLGKEGAALELAQAQLRRAFVVSNGLKAAQEIGGETKISGTRAYSGANGMDIGVVIHKGRPVIRVAVGSTRLIGMADAGTQMGDVSQEDASLSGMASEVDNLFQITGMERGKAFSTDTELKLKRLRAVVVDGIGRSGVPPSEAEGIINDKEFRPVLEVGAAGHLATLAVYIDPETKGLESQARATIALKNLLEEQAKIRRAQKTVNAAFADVLVAQSNVSREVAEDKGEAQRINAEILKQSGLARLVLETLTPQELAALIKETFKGSEGAVFAVDLTEGLHREFGTALRLEQRGREREKGGGMQV